MRSRPPAVQPPGGLACVWTPFWAALLALTVLSRTASPQFIRGTIKTEGNQARLAGAKVTVTDSLGKELFDLVSDPEGRFRFTMPEVKPFQVNVMRIGQQPSSTEWIRAAASDTLDLELLVPSDPITLAAVEVLGTKSANARSLEEARRSGWKVYEPELVERHRGTARDFNDLLREVAASSVHVGRPGECVRSVRFGRCLVYVLDGVPSGPSIFVNPNDVYFFAVLSATESAVRWGNRAPWGAIVVYTRMYGDPRKP
jgi:hypothetical protein